MLSALVLSACALPQSLTQPQPEKDLKITAAETGASQHSTSIENAILKVIDDDLEGLTSAGTSPQDPATGEDTAGLEIEDSSEQAGNTIIWDRLREGFVLERHLEKRRVKQQLSWFTRHPDYIQRVTQRSQPYMYYILQQADAHNIPYDIALLPIVESAFDPFAYSHGRASGMWQFIPSTGRMYGLKQNWWYDGRRDVVASTEAAYRFLGSLHRQFNGNWLHALAAYNSGAGTVKKAIRANKRKGRPTDFFSLRLPRETRAYVPKLLALAELFDRPEHYRAKLTPVDDAPYLAIVDIDGQIDLAQAAEMTGVTVKKLYSLNPGFNRWATPPMGPNRLLIPLEKEAQFTQRLAQLAPDERIKWTRYKIRSGDSLSAIAKQHRVTTSLLASANQLKGYHIRAGETLLIPSPMKASESYSLSTDQRKDRKANRKLTNGTKINYRVKRGDSLWLIAKRYGVSVRELAKWNSMAPGDTLSERQRLVIWQRNKLARATTPPSYGPNVTRKIVYKVKRGDSLSRIANKFQLEVKDIASWNQGRIKKYLQPGQPLNLYVDITSLN